MTTVTLFPSELSGPDRSWDVGFLSHTVTAFDVKAYAELPGDNNPAIYLRKGTVTFRIFFTVNGQLVIKGAEIFISERISTEEMRSD